MKTLSFASTTPLVCVSPIARHRFSITPST